MRRLLREREREHEGGAAANFRAEVDAGSATRRAALHVEP